MTFKVLERFYTFSCAEALMIRVGFWVQEASGSVQSSIEGYSWGDFEAQKGHKGAGLRV